MNRFILSIAGLAAVLVVAQQGLFDTTETAAPLEPALVFEQEPTQPVPETETDADLSRASLFQF